MFNIIPPNFCACISAKLYPILARKKASNKIKYIFVVLNYFCIRAHALIIGIKINVKVFLMFVGY